MKKKINTQVETKVGLAVKGAIGVDQVNSLGYVADLEVDCAKGNYFKILLKGNIRLQLLNMLPGSYIFMLRQDGAGSHEISYNSQFRFMNGTDGSLSAVAGATDLLSCIYDGTNVFAVVLKNFT